MRITDPNELQKLVDDDLFVRTVHYSFERKDFDTMFPSIEEVQALEYLVTR